MITFLITDQNFDDIKSCSETTPAGIVTKLCKNKSKRTITVSLNTMAPFAIYKWEQAGHYAISNVLDEIEKHVQTLGFELTYANAPSKYKYKPFVDKARNCSNVQKITQWSKVVFGRDGNIQITPPPNTTIFG